MTTTVIVPFHQNLTQLRACLGAIRGSAPDAQVVVAADGAKEDCRELVAAHAAVLVEVPGPSGPAVARNRAAALACGDVLIFVDTDVVVAPEAILGLTAVLSGAAEVAAVFGAYDLEPPALNFMSQFKNLSHTYVHEIGNQEASTFWAGLGAVRTQVFRAVGGFDERFARPSVEDIDLGYRIVQAGHRIRLDPRHRGTHLKRWTFWSCVKTDIQARGIPWTQLLHRYSALKNDLNTSHALRLSVVLSFAFVASAIGAWFWPKLALGALAAAGGLVGLNVDYYRWMARRRGVVFAARVLPVHLIHHLCNGVSFVAGTALHLANQRGLRLPGALPLGTWPERHRRLAGTAEGQAS